MSSVGAAFDDNRQEIERWLLDEGPELVLLIDLATTTIIAARGAGQRVLGLPNEALVHQPVSSLAPVESVPRELAPFDASMVENPGVFAEVMVQTKGGQRVVSIRVHPFVGVDGRQLSLARLLDVSGHHQLAASLRQMHQQLQEAFRTVAEQERSLAEARRAASLSIFAAGLAHELNNPVAALVANVSVMGLLTDKLKDQYPSGQPQPEAFGEMAEITTEMTDASKRVSLVVNALKELETVPRASPFDVVSTVRGLVMKQPNIAIESAEKLQVTSDASLLKRLLEKLLDNAKKTASAVTVRIAVANGTLRIEVDDQGPGIEAKYNERIFDPFFSMRPPGQGLGLGLFLARRAAHRLGGEVTLTSKSGPGACFVLAIPTQMPAPAPQGQSYEAFRGAV